MFARDGVITRNSGWRMTTISLTSPSLGRSRSELADGARYESFRTITIYSSKFEANFYIG